MRKYYKAYDKRYRQVHKKKLSWSSDNNTQIIIECIKKYNINKDNLILEIGCGEGRDARYLLKQGYNVLASDVSKEAINYCKLKDKENRKKYLVLDVLDCKKFKSKFDFIYSVACIHMLTQEEDRNNYYKFIYNHLNSNGLAIILSMGDGKKESISNYKEAWEDTVRTHQMTETKMKIATTSCKIVNIKNFHKEIENNGFKIIEHGITEIIPDFKEMMYAVIKLR